MELRRMSDITAIAAVGLPLGLFVAFTIRITALANLGKRHLLLPNLLTVCIIAVAYWVLRIAALGGREDPIGYVGNYLLAKRARVKLCVWWVVCIIGAVALAPLPNRTVPKTVARKWYHILCLLMFYPAVVSQEHEFMGLAFA